MIHMKKICITIFSLLVAFAVVPLSVEGQTLELTEDEKLAQIAVQLKDIEQEVNRLTLLVTKVALEKQAADLQRQLAAVLSRQESVAAAPVAAQPAEPVASLPATRQDVPTSGGQANSPQFSEVSLGEEDIFTSQEKDEKASGFAAALGPLGNLGTPELVALIILAFLAIFVLARRLRSRKQESEVNAPIFPSKQPFVPADSSSPSRDLLEEGKQELSEKVAWK